MRSALLCSAFFLILLALLSSGVFAQANGKFTFCGQTDITLRNTQYDFSFKLTEKPIAPFTCIYTITTYQHATVLFNVTELNFGDKSNCDLGYMNVSYIPGTLSTPRKHLCGYTEENKLIDSTGNQMFILIYVAKDATATSIVGTFTKVIPPNDDACGPNSLTLQGSSATLTIPATGKTFKDPIRCTYNITGNDNKNLTFKFKKLILGNDNNCTFDFLKLSNSEETIEGSRLKYCGSQTPMFTFTSVSNSLFLVMQSVTSPAKTSIEAIYGKENLAPQLTTTKVVIFSLLAVLPLY